MKKKNMYITLTTLLLFSILGYYIYSYIYQEHRDIASEDIEYSLSPNDLKNVMSIDSMSHQFIDRVIQTKGLIISVEQNSVVIDDIVQVNFINTDTNTLQAGTTLSIKGRCVGYDDLLEVVKIDQATIINQ